ncbi:hypothetical protein [Methylobacterium mesophilicum]
MAASTRHFLSVIDGGAQFFLAQEEKGVLTIARGDEVDLAEAEDHGVGRGRIEEVNRIFTAYDGFNCPIITTDDADEAEDSLNVSGYKTIECTEGLYKFAIERACSFSQIMMICDRTATGLLDFCEVKSP